MSKNSSSGSKKSKKSKKSTRSTKSTEKKQKSTRVTKSVDKAKTTRPRSPCLPNGVVKPKTPAATNKSVKKSTKSRSSKKKPVPKPATVTKSEKTKSRSSKSKHITSNATFNSAVSADHAQLEKVRRQVQQLDAEYRAKVEEETKKFQQLEAEQMQNMNEQNLAALEKQIKQIQDVFQAKIEFALHELGKQQAEQISQMQAAQSYNVNASEGKRAELEKEIQAKQDEAQADIAKYSQKRTTEMEEQIKRIRQQCQTDIEEYTARRLHTSEQLLEQIKQKLDLEIRNDQQTSKLSITLKVDKVKERFAKAQTDEVGRLNQEMTQAIAELRATNEDDIGQRRVESKRALHKNLENVRARLEEEYKEERAKLESTIEALEAALKGNMKQAHRDFERRKKMKQELLVMLGMDDMWRLTDEELITRRHHYTIERSTIVQQSAASTIYQASKEGETFFCKVTMLEKWSTRHRTDFGKHSTRLARYLTMNHEKAPYFVKVLEVLATNAKVYTFMEPLESTKTLQVYLDSLGAVGGKRKKSSGRSKSTMSRSCNLRSGLQKVEVINVLMQVVPAIRFLNNMFVAHANLTADNITVFPANATDLSECQLVLTGLTRPIVYYNVESDMIIAVKGFDPPSAEESIDSIEHLPAECFDTEFTATYLDAYSIGVLAYQLLRLCSPFYKVTNKKMLATKQTDFVKLTLDGKTEVDHNQLPSLIAALTRPVQHTRLPYEDILDHVYFKQ